MNNSNVITTDEAIGNIFNNYPQVVEPIKRSLIAFAKMHVNAALKAASEKATIIESDPMFGDIEVCVNKDSILNAYPLTNIK